MHNKQILLIITDLVKKVQSDRDIYLSVFISDGGVNISVYPVDDNEGTNERKDG